MFFKTIIFIFVATTQLAPCQNEVMFKTCELDLIREYPVISDYLDESCLQLVDEQKEQAIAESVTFSKFYAKLKQVEEKLDPDFIPDVNIPKMQIEIRSEIYNATQLWLCSETNSYEEFLVCLTEAREDMVTLLDNYLN